MGCKINQKSIKKGIEKQMPKKRRVGGVLEASWGVLMVLGDLEGGGSLARRRISGPLIEVIEVIEVPRNTRVE